MRTVALILLALDIALYGQNSSVELPQFWDTNTKPVAVPSPNGKLVLRVTGKATGKRYPDDEMVPDYYLQSAGRRLQPSIRAYSMPTALWSPKSNLLSITSSDGGLVGDWKVFVYTVEENRVVEHNVMVQVQTDIALRYPAGVGLSTKDRASFGKGSTWVNVRACRWLQNPERLMVIAGVPPSSGYGKNMGKAAVYTVEPRSGRILAKSDDLTPCTT